LTRSIIGGATFVGFERSLEEILAFFAENRFIVVEVKCEEPLFNPAKVSEENLRELEELVESMSLKLSLHAPYIDVNLASLNDYAYRSSMKAVKRSVELASRLNALYLTLHCGGFSSDYPSKLFSRAWERSKRCVARLADYASELGVVLGLENKEKAKKRNILVTPQEFALFMDGMDEGVGVVYDVGHANTWGLTAEKHIDFISSISEKLIAFHVHDNDGTDDQHLEIGKGKIDFDALIPHMKSQGVPMVLEVHSLDGLVRSKRRLEEAH